MPRKKTPETLTVSTPALQGIFVALEGALATSDTHAVARALGALETLLGPHKPNTLPVRGMGPAAQRVAMPRRAALRSPAPRPEQGLTCSLCGEDVLDLATHMANAHPDPTTGDSNDR